MHDNSNIFSYSTPISDCYVRGLNTILSMPYNIDVDYDVKAVSVDWEIIPEMRNWGIKSMQVQIKAIEFEIDWKIYTEDLNDLQIKVLTDMGFSQDLTNDSIYGCLKVNTKHKNINYSLDWDVINHLKISPSGHCYPTSCEVDYEKRTIIIS